VPLGTIDSVYQLSNLVTDLELPVWGERA